MSRSNPTQENPNPSQRWFSWSGSNGEVKYYDKQEKKDVVVGSNFQFLLLDSLSTIKGWHDPSESGIFSNEVRDTRSDMFVVKSFKGGILAEGFYGQIKDRVNSIGGKFTTNLYIAFKGEAGLEIGCISFSGAALSAWMEFSKKNRSAIFESAVKIKGSVDGQKGKVKFKTPVFELTPSLPETNDAAAELDKTLQAYFKSYLSRAKGDQAKPADTDPAQDYSDDDAPPSHSQEPPEDTDIPW
jgi:hypothetical protein